MKVNNFINRFAAVSLIMLAWSVPSFCGRIHDSTKAGDLVIVKELLKDNPELVSSKDNDGWAPLHHAAYKDRKDVAELLLANKADVNAKVLMAGESKTENGPFGRVSKPNYGGYAPLHLAAKEGYRDMAALLLANKADVNAMDNGDQTPLHVAVKESYRDVAELLLANRANVNARNKSGETPLHVAARDAYKGVVESLLNKGSDIKAKNNSGDTPLHAAVSAGHPNVAELLLTRGAEIDATNNRGWTPLYIAVSRSRKDMAEMLLANKADVNAKCSKDTSLDKIVIGTSDPARISFDGFTPLHLAAENGNRDMVELLLAGGSEINAASDRGQTALHVAAARGAAAVRAYGDAAAAWKYKDVAEFLLAHKADVNAKDKEGRTPLQMLSSSDQTGIAELLRRHGGLK
jgi:ankyrin repeat protein